ncbi:DUF4333 domain-containing protein [Pseudonocardia sp. CA-107938]|uniref:DUF4333 domain-containing protein n=1 Tax=Pseudonocardia sp. CA-107938 TaxID=3240021 RepID=UPI003D910F64
MTVDRAMPGSTDPTVAQWPQPAPYVPGQHPYEAPAGLGGMPGYGPPMPPPPPARRTGVIVAVIAAVVLVLGALGAGAWFLLSHASIDPDTVAKEISRVSQENDKAAPTDIRCPDDVPFEKGRTFTCTGTLLGKQTTYTITQNDDKGAITINYQRPVLDPAQLQKEIVRVTSSEVAMNPTDVQCPSDIRFEKGAAFTCSATLDGQQLKYTITQTDGQGGLNIAHDRVLKAKEVADELAATLSKDVGENIVAVCGADGQTVLVNPPGQPIQCGAANAAHPDRNAPVSVTVDQNGNLSYQVQ